MEIGEWRYTHIDVKALSPSRLFQEYERSLADLKLALELEPGNPQIMSALQDLRGRRGSLDAKVAAAMKKMFQ